MQHRAVGGYAVNVQGATVVQVGDGTQIVYAYDRGTWTDGVAPPPLVSVSGTVDSPYRGLNAFEERDAAFFFGRDDATVEVLRRMSRLAPGRGMMVVSGASGAGKSSLLRAGVLPRLRGTGLDGAPEAALWPCLVLTPGRAPLDELAVRAALLTGADAAAVRHGLGTDPDSFRLTARQAALTAPPATGGERGSPVTARPPAEPRLLLIVDQFEQVFTQCASEQERRAFITALSAAAGHRAGEVPVALIVLGVRADFEARCANYEELAEAVQSRYLLRPMTDLQLRLAITEPARVAGSGVDTALVEELLRAVRESPSASSAVSGAGALPHLSHALDQAWRNRAGDELTLADYEHAGGIRGSIAASADRAYMRLSPRQQAAARQVFIRLTATSIDGADTADRSTRAELTEGKSPAEAAEVEAVLEAFAGERLLTLTADAVEMSHEALLTAWPLLHDTWLAETHADRAIRTRLRATAAEWTRRSRDPSYLYRGSLLQAATEVTGRAASPGANLPLSQAERDFLHMSSRVALRARRWQQAAITGLALLTLVATGIAWIAVRNAASTAQQHAIALSRQLAAESLSADVTDPVTARQLAVAAWHTYPTDQANYAMTTLLEEQKEQGVIPVTSASAGVRGLAFSPDGRLLSTGDGDGTARLWSLAAGRPVGAPLRAGTGPNGGVTAVAFSPNGKLLATGDANGTVRLWDPSTGRPVGAPLRAATLPGGGVTAVAFSPDGKLLAAGENGIDEGTVQLWDPSTGRPAHAPLVNGTLPGGGVNAVTFSPDGKLLATGDTNGTARLWAPSTGLPVRAPLSASRGGGVNAVAFSPDGKLLATGGADGTARLWNPATGRPVGAALPVSTGPGGHVNAVAFSPGGKLLATGDADGTARLWDPATGRPAVIPSPMDNGKTENVFGMAFSPDGKLLATAVNSHDHGMVRLWNPATIDPVELPYAIDAGANGGVNAVAFSPDGQLLATGDGDGTARLWDPSTGQRAGAPLRAGSGSVGGGVTTVAFSASGKLLATGDANGTVRLWDTTTGRLVGAPLAADTGLGGSVTAVAFSPNGKLLATAENDFNKRTVRLWNPATGRPEGARLLISTFPGGDVNAVAFSPDNSLLATGDGDGTVQLWNLATGQRVGAPLSADTVSGGFVTGVAFSPDGKLLATADNDFDGGTVRLWDPATGQPVGTPLAVDTSPGGGVNAVAFSPDGTLLTAAGSDGTIQAWEVSQVANAYAALCADVGSPTPALWDQYAPGESSRKACA